MERDADTAQWYGWHWLCTGRAVLCYIAMQKHNEFSRVKTPRSCDPLLDPLCGGKSTCRLWHAKWEKVKRGDYVLLKNCKTGEYLHIENLTGYVEHGEVPATWWSAQWTESEVDGYTRLINRWQPDYSIHAHH